MRLLHFLFLVLMAAPLAGSGALAADPAKTLHTLIVANETSFDPAVASDLGTLSINENLFDPLLRYDYLARPVRLVPNTLVAMPEITDGGRTYTFRLKPGIRFIADGAFKGRARELTAADYSYSLRRLYDPKLKSPWLFLFEGLLAGDEALRPRPGAVFDGDAPCPGIEVVDRHTLRLRLREPDANLLYKLAMPATGAVAREVMAAYGDDAGSHPVGTGPYRLKEWQRSYRILLEANPDFRETRYQPAGPVAAADQPIVQALAGRRLPLIGFIDIRVMEENQGRLLGFLGGEFDHLEQVPPALADVVLTGDQLKPELAARGLRLDFFSPLQTYYLWMNMEDPVLGGYTPEKIALRRAIAMAYPQAEDIRQAERGLALPAWSPLPPNAIGHDADYRPPVPQDLRLANALLDRFGYRRGADGLRRRPDGQTLHLTMHTLATGPGRLRDESWQRVFSSIGLSVSFVSDKKGEIIKASRQGRVQMYETNWVGDFPDGENFYQLLYGPNTGKVNYARFRLPAFDRLYEKARLLPDGPERRRLYRGMNQLIHFYSPWVLRIHPLSADLSQPWLQNLRRHPVAFTAWRYLDLDPGLATAAARH